MKSRFSVSQMTKDKLVCALAWRENEGEANKKWKKSKQTSHLTGDNTSVCFTVR